MPTHTTRENNEHQDEVQLETLLTGLLERTESRGALAPTAVLPEIAELRDTARRLRAASQWVPLPEGRLAVRRALMALAQQGLNHGIPGRAAWRRAGLWLSTVTALAVVVGAFGLGAGALDPLTPPSSPAYGLRLALDRARSQIIPGRPDASGYALPFEFSAVQVPSKPGTTATTAGRLGGLPATLSMTRASGCRAGAPCGKFVVSVAGLAAPASATFGELSGTFACEAGGCILTAAEMTGVFARVSVTALSLHTTGPNAGRLGSNIASLGEWRSAVAAASEGLNTPEAPPGGGTVSGPAQQAAIDDKRDPAKRGGANTIGADTKRGGGTGKTGGMPNDHPSTSTGHGVADSHHGHSTAMDNDDAGTASGPDVADDRQGKDKDQPTAPGSSGVADKRQGQDHSKAPGGPDVDNGQRGPGAPKDHVHPSPSSSTKTGERGAHNGTDTSGGPAGASGGSNRGGGGTGRESGDRSRESASEKSEHEKEGSGGGDR